MTLRLLQHVGVDGTRSVIAATNEGAAFVTGVDSVRALAERAIADGTDLATATAALGTGASVDIVAELAAGRLTSPIDHVDPAHLIMTGTGLTHLGSAEGRDKMHRAAADAEKPEWFYKGDGSGLVAPGAAFAMPDFAEDGGEEPELAGIYLIGPDGTPFRLGLCLANEFSDHVTERHNYLWLAHSKLRQASLGPELLVGTPPEHIEGASRIHRDGALLWEKPFLSGEANMSHTIANLEAHHFKYDLFRRPGDVHVHFFGTATLSFADGVTTREGDVFEIEAAPFTLPLRNTLTKAAPQPVTVKAL
jgi:hypothetical protein